MKRKMIYAALMLVALSAPAVAQGFEPGTMRPREIMRMLRSTGFEPMSRPMRRGPNYVVFAVDNRDREVRLEIGAHTGDDRVGDADAVLTAARWRTPPSSPGHGVNRSGRVRGRVQPSRFGDRRRWPRSAS